MATPVKSAKREGQAPPERALRALEDVHHYRTVVSSAAIASLLVAYPYLRDTPYRDGAAVGQRNAMWAVGGGFVLTRIVLVAHWPSECVVGLAVGTAAERAPAPVRDRV